LNPSPVQNSGLERSHYSSSIPWLGQNCHHGCDEQIFGSK
jgi:hypothetical protein